MLPLLSWAFYDFANTIFSAIVLTVYFPLYLTDLAHGTHWYLGAATTASMILAGMVVPFLGALSDQTGRTKAFLILATFLCILFLIPLSFIRSPMGLILFFLLASFFYHASLVFYNSLLPVVAEKKKQGFASGLGTGLGYLGVVFSIPIAHLIDQKFGRPPVFSLAAVLFLLCSLPLFFFVPEREVPCARPFRWSMWNEEWKKIWNSVKRLPQQPDLLWFLVGNFFAVDALNTMIFWFMVFGREVFHPPQRQLISLLLAVNTSAFFMGLLAGFLTDRLGGLKVMILATIVLALSLGTLAVLPDFFSFAAVSILGGAFAIAGIWTAGRKALIELAQPAKVGEYFGLYGLTTKISVIGSLIFSMVADGAGFRLALWTLVVPASMGVLFLWLSRRLHPDG